MKWCAMELLDFWNDVDMYDLKEMSVKLGQKKLYHILEITTELNIFYHRLILQGDKPSMIRMAKTALQPTQILVNSKRAVSFLSSQISQSRLLLPKSPACWNSCYGDNLHNMNLNYRPTWWGFSFGDILWCLAHIAAHSFVISYRKWEWPFTFDVTFSSDRW